MVVPNIQLYIKNMAALNDSDIVYSVSTHTNIGAIS